MKRQLFSLMCGFSAFLTAAAPAFGAGPFGYPATLLDTPATLSEPPADFLRMGKPKIELWNTTLAEAAEFTGATRLREGRGVFARDYMCLSGTEAGQPVLAWIISSDTKNVTEVQLEKPAGDIPGFCKPLPIEMLPLRLGKIGLGMSAKTVEKLVGPASYQDGEGWKYWFSQRWLRNARNLQELELNWLAVLFKDGKAEKAFISLVKNP